MRNKPKIVILHCSDTPDFRPHETGKFDAIGAKEIDLWHKERGFDCIGYHDVIRQSGLIEAGRPIERIGAHAYGANVNSIGLCLIGRMDFQKKQIESLISIFKAYRAKYAIGPESWFTHRHFDHGKTCPNIPLHILRALLNRC